MVLRDGLQLLELWVVQVKRWGFAGLLIANTPDKPTSASDKAVEHHLPGTAHNPDETTPIAAGPALPDKRGQVPHSLGSAEDKMISPPVGKAATSSLSILKQKILASLSNSSADKGNGFALLHCHQLNVVADDSPNVASRNASDTPILSCSCSCLLDC